MNISGKTCIITGAANGVGLAIAQRFAESGASVMMADIEEDHLTMEAERLQADGYAAAAFAGDLRERLSIANLISATLDAYDRIDVLVNASRKVLYAEPLDMSPDDLGDLFDQNVGANLRLSQAVVRRFLKQAEEPGATGPTGAIVNVSSIASNRTQPALMGYSVSTAALDQLTRAMAVALAEDGIRVNAIAIGSVMSASLRDAMAEDDTLRDRIVSATPINRIGDATEAAEVVQFLASEAASFVTGQIVNVDGARSLLDPAGLAAL